MAGARGSARPGIGVARVRDERVMVQWRAAVSMDHRVPSLRSRGFTSTPGRSPPATPLAVRAAWDEVLRRDPSCSQLKFIGGHWLVRDGESGNGYPLAGSTWNQSEAMRVKLKHGLLVCVATLASLLATASRADENVSAGPIWNDNDAKARCPRVCDSAHGHWNGQWKTTRPGIESVCGCSPRRDEGDRRGLERRDRRELAEPPKDLEAGPLWDDADARNRCPDICSSAHRHWEGQWRTTEPGHSVCACAADPDRMEGRHVERDRDGYAAQRSGELPAGPIWNADEAQNACPRVCASVSGQWSGQWRTVREGAQAVCGCLSSVFAVQGDAGIPNESNYNPAVCGPNAAVLSAEVAEMRGRDACSVATDAFGDWAIARLARGASQDGSGYGCGRHEQDYRDLGGTLCIK